MKPLRVLELFGTYCPDYLEHMFKVDGISSPSTEGDGVLFFNAIQLPEQGPTTAQLAQAWLLGNSGSKLVSPLLERWAGMAGQDGYSLWDKLGAQVGLRYYVKWKQIADALYAEYSPLVDDEYTRCKTFDRDTSDTANRSVSHESTENTTTTRTGTTDTDTAGSDNSQNNVYSFNSVASTPQPAKTDNSTSINGSTTTENATDTVENTSGDTTTENGTNTVKESTSETENVTGRHKSAQSLIEEELRLRMFNTLMDIELGDLDAMMCLDIY